MPFGYKSTLLYAPSVPVAGGVYAFRNMNRVNMRKFFVEMDVSDMSADDYELYATLANDTVKCAQIIVAMIPILCVYPFLQRYFVTGIVLGSVKG